MDKPNLHTSPFSSCRCGFFAAGRLLWFFVIALLAAGCANEVNPMGGPRDQTGPVLVKTVPQNKTLFFKGNEVTFYFDEFVKPVTYGKEIFISPFQATRPKIMLNNKKLKIKFNDPLRPNTTYVITLNEVQDHFEGNKMKDSYTFAFSTGGVLDSLEIRGRVLKPTLGQGQDEMTMLLFDADSVVGNHFFQKQPAYITKTTETGMFSFPFLRNSAFKIYGIIDKDQNNRYSQLTEVIAISDRPIVEFDSLVRASDSLRQVQLLSDSLRTDSLSVDTLRADSVSVDSLLVPLPDSAAVVVDSVDKAPEAIFAFRVLYSFLPDDAPPVLRGYNWVRPNTVIARFSEGLLQDSLRISVSDTLGNEVQSVADFTFVPTQEMELLIHSPRLRDSLSLLSIQNLRDSLGNRSDTTVALNPRRAQVLKQALFVAPAYDFERQQFRFVSVLISPDDTARVFVTDTARAPSPGPPKAGAPAPRPAADSPAPDSTLAVPTGALPVVADNAAKKDSLFVPRRLPLRLETQAFRVAIVPLETPKPKKTYLLNIKGELLFPNDSLLHDSVFIWSLVWPDKAEYGTLSGSIRIDTAEYQGPIKAELINDKDVAIRTFFDTTFQFTMLPPGKYRFRITLDEDGNRAWTPGSLNPYRLPEKIYVHGAPVDIRANWEFEDHLVEVQLKNVGDFAAPPAGKETAEGAAPVVPGKAGQAPGNRPAGIPTGGK